MKIRVDVNDSPIVDQFSEEGFVDLVFRIHDLVDAGGEYQFRMAASFDGQTLGVDVSVVKDVGPGFDDDMQLIKEHVYRQGVRLTRSGPESDRLVRTIAKLYALEHTPQRMVDKESYTAIALHQGLVEMAIKPVKLKIFGKDGPDDAEDDYYESFFNLDLANGFVFWNEKDQEYREALVRALSGA